MKKICFAIIMVFMLAGCKSSILDDPTTTIFFTIPERSHVKLTVENNYNTIVATLLDEELNAGIHNTLFESADLAEGVYYYTLEVRGIESGNYSKTTKYMLMVK